MQTVSVTLNSQKAYLTHASEEALDSLGDFWAFYAPGHFYAPAFKQWQYSMSRLRSGEITPAQVSGWDGKIRFLKRGTLPAGLFRATYQEAEKKLGIKFEIHRKIASRFTPPLPGKPGTEERYQYQEACADAMCGAVKRGGGIVLACTGSGKTKVSADFFARTPSYSCLFLVDQIDLLYQSQKEIAQWLGEEVGVVGNSQFAPKRVTVATRQTLHKHLGQKQFYQWYDHIDIVVVDELHEQLNHSNFDIVNEIKPLAKYGLTATLQIKKKEIAYRAYAFAGPVLYEFPVAEGMEKGVLAEGSVLQLRFDPLNIPSSTYAQAYMDQVVDHAIKYRACKKIVEEAIRQGRYVLVLVERLKHLHELDEHLFADIPHRTAWGGVDKTDRLKARKKFEKGDIRLLIANQVFRKGINLKRVDLIIDLAETTSKNSALQKFGRGVRLHPDKTALLYVDFGASCGRFLKATTSRYQAFKTAKIPIEKVIVAKSSQAAAAVVKALDQQAQLCLFE